MQNNRIFYPKRYPAYRFTTNFLPETIRNIRGAGLRMGKSSGLRAQGSGLRAQGSGLRAQGSGLRAKG